MAGMTHQSNRSAARSRPARPPVEVILHLGAHRTATTSFQHYLRENAPLLSRRGIGFWGPWRTRGGLLSGIFPRPGPLPAEAQFARARGRIALQLDRAGSRGVHRVIVSDENLIGAPRRNLREGRLYVGIGERLARVDAAFGGRITRVVFSPRSQESYWSSVLAYGVACGHRLPGPDDLDRLAGAGRGWREVIGDLACALPGAEILVMPYESAGARPERRLAAMTGRADAPRRHAREWMNAAPGLAQLRRHLAERGSDPARLPAGEGRWHPFDREQSRALRAAYEDDLRWLRAGAGGLAILIEETGPAEAGQQPPAGRTTRGHRHGIEERRLA